MCLSSDPKSVYSGPSMMSRNDGPIDLRGPFMWNIPGNTPQKLYINIVAIPRGIPMGHHWRSIVYVLKIYQLCILNIHFLIFLCLRATYYALVILYVLSILRHSPLRLTILDSFQVKSLHKRSKVASSRPDYYSILHPFVHRSHYISIKFPLQKQSEIP